MAYYLRILAALVGSALLHWLLSAHLESLEEAPARDRYTVRMEVRHPPPAEPEPPPEPERPPEPEPEPPPEPKVFEPPPPQPKPKPKPKPRRKRPPPKTPPPQDLPTPNTTDAPATAEPVRPRFGISMSSTSSAGAGPAMPVGNTLERVEEDPEDKGKAKKPPKAYAEPPPVETVTRMPRMLGSCRGKYTKVAREAGLEGTVVLSLLVDTDGRARDIQVVRGLGHGLTEAAIRALERCRFRPGQRNGQPVSVRLRSFKIRFVLDDGG